MAQVNYKESGDLAKLRWTLEGGSSPMQRIYSTVKHLGSRLGYQDVQQMVESEVLAGTVLAQPHPFREGEYFYSLAQQSNVSKV